MKTDELEQSPALDCSALRTFEVAVIDWPEAAGIYAATSPAKAKFKAWSAAQEAGYESVTFGKLRVRRTPQFDPIAGKIKNGVDRSHARLLMQNS